MPDTVYPIVINETLQILIQLAAAALLAFGTWAAKRFADKLKLSADSQTRAYLNDAMARAIDFAKGQAGVFAGSLPPINIRSKLAADAAAYLLPKVPDALAKLGIDEKGLREMLTARLSASPTPAVTTTVEVEPSTAVKTGPHTSTTSMVGM